MLEVFLGDGGACGLWPNSFTPPRMGSQILPRYHCCTAVVVLFKNDEEHDTSKYSRSMI